MCTFSVVIPLYNKAETIQRTIVSVLTQTFCDFELIVVNDGSTDGCERQIRDIQNDDRIRVIDQSNKGVSAARNRGIAESKGKYIAFLDADDEWLPYYLEKVALAISMHPDTGLFCVPALHRNIKTGFGTFYTVSKFASRFEYVNVFESKRLLAQTSGITIKTSCFKSFSKRIMNGFPTNMSYGEDSLFFYSIAMTTRCVYIGYPLCIRNTGVNGQLVSYKNSQTLLRCQSMYLNQLYSNYQKCGVNIPYFNEFFDFEIRTLISESCHWGYTEQLLRELSKNVTNRLYGVEFAAYKTSHLTKCVKKLLTKLLRLKHFIRINSYKYD